MKKLLIIFTVVMIWTCSSPTKSEPAPQPPTVNNLSITTNEDTPTTFTMTGADPEGAALTFSISTQPQNGTVTASGAAGTYTPNENFNGTDTFAYIASDGALSSTAGLVSVTVNAVDDDPNTMNVSVITDEDNAVVITLEAEEYDGDTISFSIKDNPTSGTVTISGDKATYTPNENYYGSDSFTFEAVDYTAKKILNTATASITINPINDAPTATDLEADAFDNQSINIDLPVEDIDEDNLSIQIIDNPSKVTLSLNGSAVTVYNPNQYWGTDSFTYQAYDGTAYSETKTVSLGMKRNIDYNIPYHDFKNYHMPWFDLATILEDLGFDKNNSYNTSSAYADFNGDNYFDITIQPNVSDGASVETYFLTNNGDNTFYIDYDFPVTVNDVVISSRKTIVGDFNGDSKPDVVRPQGGHSFFGQAHITLSDPNSNEYELRVIGDAPMAQSHTMASGDIDNDGDLDLFISHGGGTQQKFDGFLINDGNANFSWKYISEVINDFENGYIYPNGGYGLYGFWTAEITDVDNDGFVDLLIGAIYHASNDEYLKGPIIFWGNGSGQYSISESSIIFEASQMNYWDMDNITYDFSVNDVDGDGLKDIIMYTFIDGDSNLYQFAKAVSDRQFEDKTEQMLPNFLINNSWNHVWTIVRDIDNNGQIDIIEGEPRLAVPWPIEWRNSVRWEWNGSSFTRIQ
mgnify:FL=1